VVNALVVSGEGAVVVTVSPRNHVHDESDVALKTAPHLPVVPIPSPISQSQYQSNLDRLYVNPLKVARFI
jgi:hypothetical protein